MYRSGCSMTCHPLRVVQRALTFREGSTSRSTVFTRFIAFVSLRAWVTDPWLGRRSAGFKTDEIGGDALVG